MESKLITLKHHLENRIITLRGVQVLLDRDLAVLYEVETRVLNQAVKRNIGRFPQQFCFQLTEIEFKNWLSQLVMSNSEKMSIRRSPYAFTEQGVAMLSAVLRSDVAVKVSIQIMIAFVEMRKVIQQNTILIQRIEGIEKKQHEADQKFEQIFDALENKEVIPPQGVFFDGQVFDAYVLASKIIRSARKRIVLIDNYIDENTLIHLSKKSDQVHVLLLTKNKSTQVELDVQKVNQQVGNFELRYFDKSHDRFLIIDSTEVYHLGASLKDLGKKMFAFSKLEKRSVEQLFELDAIFK